MTNDHLEHEPYLHAVADAITATGEDIDDVVANPDDPRDGYIAIGSGSAHVLGADEDDVFVLGWSEEKGWDCGIDREGRGRVQYLYAPRPPLSVLAPPSQVAGWFRDVLADGLRSPHCQPHDGTQYRLQSDDDIEFEEELAEYAAG